MRFLCLPMHFPHCQMHTVYVWRILLGGQSECRALSIAYTPHTRPSLYDMPHICSVELTGGFPPPEISTTAKSRGQWNNHMDSAGASWAARSLSDTQINRQFPRYACFGPQLPVFLGLLLGIAVAGLYQWGWLVF